MRQREEVPAPRRWGRQPRRRLLAAIGAEAERRASIPIPRWEDTVNIKKNGSVRIVVEFRDYPGKRMCHCHTLAHEDHGMMAILDVE